MMCDVRAGLVAYCSRVMLGSGNWGVDTEERAD
jgi:hypothetical protein